MASSLLETPVTDYAWLVTEEVLSMEPLVVNVTTDVADHIPKTLLAVDGSEAVELPNFIQTVLQVVR